MTTRDKPADPDPERAWEYVQKLVDEDEIERIGALSEEEVAAELKAAGYTRQTSVEELLAKARAKAEAAAAASAPGVPAVAAVVAPVVVAAPVVPLPIGTSARARSRAVRASWLLAAAVAGVVALVEGPHIVEWLSPHRVAKPPDETLLRAEALREQAFASLALGRREGVREKLDEALSLDPTGESDPRVQEARKALAAPETPAPSGDRKGP